MHSTDQIIAAFVDALAAHGVKPSDTSRIQVDGAWHRLHIEGDRGRAENLSYRIFNDDRPAGFFEDHKRGFSGTFTTPLNGNGGASLTPEQRAEQQARWAADKHRRETEQAIAYAEAAERAAKALQAAKADPALHPYVVRKAVPVSAGMRATADGLLLIPVYSDFDRLASYQSIDADGNKLFMPGGRMAGAFHPIIGPDKARVLVCEGWATGAALRAATRHSVACAMSAGNLPAVVAAMRAKFPGREIVAAVDNDHETERRTGKNPGVEFGVASGARLFVPIFDVGADSTDWHDFITNNPHADVRAMLDNPEAAGPEPSQQEEVIENVHRETGAAPVTQPAATPDQPAAGDPYP
ncbi:MAG: toprim domain-containing protein [Acidobacteria bacterium]|nr:toprim domain-containing protein [Acidobacteriota bacterium]